MERLEELLDKEVERYLSRVEEMDEVRSLLDGSISKETYIKFLKTFFIIEDISHRAVHRASGRTAEGNPYLSERFMVCARGEIGHAEIALNDLRGLGVKDVDLSDAPTVAEYDEMLQEQADKFPLGILGHSYLFENVSGLMFPKNEELDYPSTFIEVHAKEDPGHSLAIKRTVRNIESDLTDVELGAIIDFTKKSGEHFIRLFESL